MRIKELRKAAGLTQQELGKTLNISTQAISNYELGKRQIPVSMLPQIKEALGCTWAELFGEEEHNA